MRTREQIEVDQHDKRHTRYSADMYHAELQEMALEVLLDIRELLSRPGVQSDFGKAEDEIKPK